MRGSVSPGEGSRSPVREDHGATSSLVVGGRRPALDTANATAARGRGDTDAIDNTAHRARRHRRRLLGPQPGPQLPWPPRDRTCAGSATSTRTGPAGCSAPYSTVAGHDRPRRRCSTIPTRRRRRHRHAGRAPTRRRAGRARGRQARAGREAARRPRRTRARHGRRRPSDRGPGPDVRPHLLLHARRCSRSAS